ncbi:MAG: inorganic pyrophosphatase Ppa [Deltaproteobacteria bacterium RIFOXYD12_FULL_57_12]|nr:MAG: inorganic pyrophosphatase Ppa [Deltaproteobacteria bacterium RIFOXYD12_FULL_57_12]
MTISTFPQASQKLEIQGYKQPCDNAGLWKNHVPFSGSPQKHPYNPQIILLVADPYSSNTSYFEFNTSDISHIEELPNIVDPEGQTITMVRIWVKKSSAAVRCTPFIVEDTRRP